MWHYRCQNPRCSDDPHGRLIFDFAAEEPICPKCGTDGRKPEYANIVIKLVIVHFDPPHPTIGDRGMRVPACRPDKKLSELPGVRATGDPTVVTCEKCRETDAFKKVQRELRAWEEGDMEVEIDLANFMVKPKKG